MWAGSGSQDGPLRRVVRRIRDLPIFLWPLIWTYRGLLQLGFPLDSRIFKHIPYRGIVQVSCPNGGRFRIFSAGGVTENELYWVGLFSHEPGSMRLWLKHAASARVILDVGANAGLYSLAAATLGDARIHAFEPIERVREILDRNVALNGYRNITVWERCVGERSGRLRMFDPGGESPSSASASAEFVAHHLPDASVTAVEVAVVSLDDFCAEQGIEAVDLVKIDVEGFEPAVFAGMKNTLRRFRPVMLVEALDPVEPTMARCIDEIKALGYTAERVDEEGIAPNRNLILVPDRAR